MLVRVGAGAGSGSTVTPNVWITPELEAVNIAGVNVFMLPVCTVNVAEVEPCGTITLEGTRAALLLELDSETVTPPVPAAAVKLTVPVPVWPLTIVLGLTETPLSAADSGVIVTPNVMLTPE
jgi:hypothetical protein